jgi:O-antigen/teichoic acid export membrane protein
MNKPLSLISSAIWNILTICITAIAGFIIVPLIIRSIGNENFGIYTIILMIGGFVGLQNLGLGEATLKYVAQYYSKNDIEGVNRVLGATLTVYSFSAVVISGLMILFAGDITVWFKISSENISSTTEAFRIAGFAFLMNTFKGVLQTIPEAVQRYDILNKYILIMLFFKYIAMYIVLKFGAGIIGLTYLILACELVDILVYFFLAKYLVPGIKCRPHFSKNGIKEVFSYGIFSFTNDLIQKAALQMDKFILGIFYSTSAVAYLSAPKDLLSRANGLTGAAGRGLFPRFSSIEEGEKMRHLYAISLWILTILSLTIFVPLAIIIPAFLAKWISPEFASKSSAFAILYSLGIALNGGVPAYQALLKGTGRIKWLTKIISTLTVLSGIVTAILVFKFGLIGAGVRVILFSWIGITLCFYIGEKIFTTFRLWTNIVQTAIIPISIGVIIFFGGKFYIDCNPINTWFEIIATYFVSIIVMLVLQVLSNVLFFRKDGGAYYFMLRLKRTKSESPKTLHY